MDTNLEKRTQRQAALLACDLKKTSRESFWFGVVMGLLVGLAVGAAVAYHTIDRVVVLTMDHGIEV